MVSLRRLMPEQAGQGPATGTIGRHAPESSEPWNAEAAHAYWGIWFGIRKLADVLRKEAGFPSRSWGSDTAAAAEAVAGLAVSVRPEVLAQAAQRAESWVAQATRIRDIDTGDVWEPVPRVPGSAPPACPYCDTLSLRMSKAREEVRCFFPGCCDLDGHPTRAKMMRSVMHPDRGQLVFGDGTVVAYREDQPTSGGDREHDPARERADAPG